MTPGPSEQTSDGESMGMFCPTCKSLMFPGKNGELECRKCKTVAESESTPTVVAEAELKETVIMEDGQVIGTSFHRHVVAPGGDYSNEEERVQAICAAAHTPEVIEAFKAATAAQGV